MSGVAYIMVVVGILIAKAVGFLRDIVFASVFGATAYTDIYFQVFGLVNLIFTGIGVALSTLMIKNLNKAENSGNDKQREYVSYFITKTSIITVPAICVLYIFSGTLTRLLLPGLNPSLFKTAVRLMHIMLPSVLFVIIAYIISGVLQNSRIFFVTSVMSLPFNVIIIASLFVKNIDIITVGIVTTIGWFLHIAVQLPQFYRAGYRLFSYYKPKNSVSGNRREILYIFISNMMFQLCFIIDKAFVSSESGAATTINYASNLFVTIASVFVVAMSNVVFPSISKNYEEENIEYLRELIKHIVTIMFAIFLPFILTAACFGQNIIGLLYERGAFSHNLTVKTAFLFTIYSFGVFGYTCQELFNKVLFLDSKYAYTVAGTVLVVGLKPILNMLLVNHGGAFAVSITTTVLFTLYALNVALAMKKVMGNYFDAQLRNNLLKISLGGLSALAVFWAMSIFAPDLTRGKYTFILPLMMCGASYAAVLLLSGIAKTIIGRSKERIEK